MKRIKFIEYIKSAVGRIGVYSLMGYTEERTIETLGNNDFVTKVMVSSVGIQSFEFTAEAGDAWPVVLINGTDFSTDKSNVTVEQVLSPDGTQSSNSGAGTIFRINYTSPAKDVIDNIEVETATDGAGFVSERTVITVLPI